MFRFNKNLDTNIACWLVLQALLHVTLTILYIYIYMYSASPLFPWQQVGIIFHVLTGSCEMMFPISYLVYSVNYFTCLLILYHGCNNWTNQISCLEVSKRDIRIPPDEVYNFTIHLQTVYVYR